MSRHVVIEDNLEWVFGWDQPLMSFFLQLKDLNLDEEENPIVWIGTNPGSLYEVEDLVLAARSEGLEIDSVTQNKLYQEKDEGI